MIENVTNWPLKLSGFDIKLDAQIAELVAHTGRRVIFDGVVKPELYANSKIRLLWVLKNPYDSKGDIGNNWHLRNLIHGKFATGQDRSSRTWGVIATLSKCLLGNDPIDLALPIPEIPKNPKDYEFLNSIAFVNLSKFSGKTRTDPKVLKKEFEIFKPIVLEQIAEYKPNIVICGGSGDLLKDAFKNALKVEPVENQIRELAHGHFAIGNTLFIKTQHPAYLNKK